MLVGVVRDELVLFGGRVYGKDGQGDYYSTVVDVLDFYHPVKGKWRVVESFGRPQEVLFVAGGRFYSMSASEIHVYDGDENSWRHLQSFSVAAFSFAANQSVKPVEIVFAGNELLAWVGFSGHSPYCFKVEDSVAKTKSFFGEKWMATLESV
ncbi:unnamed protein product [Calypogeia fissa]